MNRESPQAVGALGVLAGSGSGHSVLKEHLVRLAVIL